MKPNRRSFVAGALCGALVGNAEVCKAQAGEDHPPMQPPAGYRVIQSFRDGFFPPFSKGSILKQGGFFFKTPEAFELYSNGYSKAQLIKSSDLIVVAPRIEITLLEGFTEFRGRAHVDGLGDGYIVLNGEF